tara:strand:+ start:87 stop:401 length:315 start_codon:yes stop_codon:yes gene_type:complete
MKVKIAYTVDLDEIPQKIQDFLKQSEELLFSKEMKDGFKSAMSAFGEGNLQVGLDTMEAIRNKLIEADIRLEDCTRVLVDYQQAVSQINAEKYKEQEGASNEER